MKVLMVGEGAQAMSYMKAFDSIEGVDVPVVVGGIEADAERFADQYGIPDVSMNLSDVLQRKDIDAVIVTSPSQIHFQQACQVIESGKHLLLEIPMALSLEESEELARRQEQSGLVCMVAHTRHFVPMFQRIKREIASGALKLHHLVTQTFFFRRVNLNRFGEPRTWTDDLLWHHACHSVDLFYWLFPEPDMQAWGQVGPAHPELGIPMDLSVGLKSRDGALLTSSLSFNNHGPLDVKMRFIGEQHSYVADPLKSTLSDTEGNVIQTDTPGSGFVNQLREFFDCIETGRNAETDFSYCAQVMGVIDRIECSIQRPSDLN